MTRTSLTLMTAVIALALGNISQAVMLDAVADGGNDQNYPGAFYNGDEMDVRDNDASGSGKNAYIKFDLGSIAAGDITAATLHLTCSDNNAANGFSVAGYNDGGAYEAWDEDGIGADKPSFNKYVGVSDVDNSLTDAELIEEVSGSPSAGDLYSIDVLSFVQNDTDGQLTFILRSGNYSQMGFAARDNTVYAGPQLELEVIPEPASLAVLGLGGLALIRRRLA